jgi:hypothetical protein
MRTVKTEAQIGTRMELRKQERHCKDQNHESKLALPAAHLFNKTELRQEWLRGQAESVTPESLSLQRIQANNRLRGYTRRWKCMQAIFSNFGQKGLRRGLAVFACLALLYFAGGGSLLHHHTGGPETPCHVCQALHMPALAAAPAKLVPASQQIARHDPLPLLATPTHSFGLHRASRAPPQA